MKLADIKILVSKSKVADINSHLFDKLPKKYSPKKRKNIPAKVSKEVSWMHWQLSIWCHQKNLKLEQEFKFSEKRKWRFDFAIPALKIGIEYEGGIFMDRSGHNSPSGIQRDVEKYNAAQSDGWIVLRFHVKNYKMVLQEVQRVVDKNCN